MLKRSLRGLPGLEPGPEVSGSVPRSEGEAEIIRLGKNDYSFEIQGDGVDLSGIANPVTVALQIANDGGTASIKAFIRQPHCHHY
jgi:hypothetical protein